jgi:hypothetical protein
VFSLPKYFPKCVWTRLVWLLFSVLMSKHWAVTSRPLKAAAPALVLTPFFQPNVELKWTRVEYVYFCIRTAAQVADAMPQCVKVGWSRRGYRLTHVKSENGGSMLQKIKYTTGLVFLFIGVAQARMVRCRACET